MEMRLHMFYPPPSSLPLAHKLLQYCMNEVCDCCHELGESGVSQKNKIKTDK